MTGNLLMDDMGDDMEELSFSEWPDPPGSHPWLPAYGFQTAQDHQLEKDDFLDPADAALFLGSAQGSTSALPPFLETIVEETMEELRSEGSSPGPSLASSPSPSPTGWAADSDADSVVHVVKGCKDECDSGSERDFLCPAKRRRPNQLRPECPPSPTDSASFLSLSRSSSLAQFESLEQSCQLLEAASPSPLSVLSLDSLDRLRGPEVYPDSLENSSDSDRNSSSSQESAYRVNVNGFHDAAEGHFNDRSLPEEGFGDQTFVVVTKKDNGDRTIVNGFYCDDEARYWNGQGDRVNGESGSSEFSDGRSSDSDRTVHRDTQLPAEAPPLKYNFKSCRSLDALSSFENLDAAKADNAYSSVPSSAKRHAGGRYSAENLSEDSGYSDHFCNFLRMKSKSIPDVSEYRAGGAAEDAAVGRPERKSEDNLPAIFAAECLKKSEIDSQFGARGKFHTKAASPDVARVAGAAGAGGGGVAPEINRRPSPARPSPSLPDLRSRPAITEFEKYFDPKRGRNTFPRSVADKLARLLDDELVFDASDANLYSVSSVPKDLNLCDAAQCVGPAGDDNWSFGSERAAPSVAAKNFDLCDLNYSRSQKTVHEVSFKRSFRVSESFTTSVADLTVLDYRTDADGASKNVLKKFSSRSSEKTAKMPRNLPSTREMSVESDSTTESEKVFLGEMQKTMRELSDQSKKALQKSLENCNFDRDISILTNKRLHSALNPFDDVIAELERKQARSKPSVAKVVKEPLPPPPPPPPAYEFNYYGDETDPPYYRRHYDVSNSNTENSSPDVSETFNPDMFFHSTPMKGTDKVQSTPNLNAFNQDSSDMYSSVAPTDELRSSMQHVPLKSEFKPVGILGSKSQGLSGSGGSKGVHFCPIVAEVSWRERSYSEDSANEVSSSSSSYSSAYDPPPQPAPPRLPAEPRTTPAVGPGGQGGGQPGGPAPGSVPRAARACAPPPQPRPPMEKPTVPPKPPRSRIGGFLSRFANFRFSSRKKQKKDSASNVSDNSARNGAVVTDPERDIKRNVTGSGGDDGGDFVYIPLKPASGRPPLPPGRTPRCEPRPEPPGPPAPAPAPAPAPSPGPFQPGLLETDLDTETTRTVQLAGGTRARSLLQLPPPTPVGRTHKSMEYLLDKENLRCVEPPENDLQKNSADRVLSEHQLRVQRSLQKLNLPDWYKNSPAPQQGFLLKKRASDATPGQGWPQTGLSGKTTSLGSLGQPSPPQNTGPARSPLTLTPQPYAFTRWSTSRLNSNQTSPCSSARSSIRGSGSGPPTPPSPSQRLPRPSRQPYLGWRSQERLSTPRTPHERLAVSLLPQSPPVPANVSEEIQTSIKEVTSAIVHYVSGLEPSAQDTSRAASPRGGRLCWVESSFVGTKPLESPQTPVVVSQPSPISQGQTRPLQLDLQPNGHTPTVASTTYQHDWQSPQRSLLNLGVSRPSPGSTTLEDVLDSLLGLPSAAPRAPSPQTSPRSPYMLLGLQSRYTDRSGSQCSSLQFSISSRTEDYRTASRISGEDVAEPWDVPQHLPYQPHHQQQQRLYDEEVSSAGRRRSSAGSSTTSTLAPGTDGADKDDNSSILSLPKLRGRAKSVASKRNASRRQSEPVTAQKSVSLDRRVSYDSHLLKTDLSLSRTSVSELQQSKTSLKSIASINTDASGEDMLVHCRYTKCTSATSHGEAKRHYKSCHNCNYMYCSRECRRAHWEKHRKICLHSRASTLCKQILSTAKEDTDSLHHVSAIAHKGYLAHGRGVVKAFFTSPEAAEKFTVNGFQNLGEPTYVKWPDLLPNEMGPELYAELVKLCKSYNPETRLVLYVAVCIISEVPTKGAVVKWERQLVSRCAKIRLSKTVMGSIPHGQLPFHSSPKARVRSRDKQHRDKDKMLKIGNIETLILTSNSANLHNKGNYSVQKIREVSFNNIQMQLQKRGVNLKKHFPEVYSKLCAYVEGTCDKFTPMTVYPRDNLTGKSFMCVIMPETEPDKFYTLPRDSLECRTVDVSISDDAGLEQVSTPM